MTSCSYLNMASFRLEADLYYIYDDYDVVLSPDGCYEEYASTTVDGRFYSDGDLDDGEYFFKTRYLSEFDDLVDDVDDSDDVEVWVIATYQNGVTTTRCRDYFLYDYTTQHPTQVSSWDCEDEQDGDWVYEATISTTCGCDDTPAPMEALTPAPTPARTATPATLAPTATPPTPLPTAPSAPAPPAASATPSPLAAAEPTSDSLTPALTTTFSPTRAPEVASSPHPVSTASDEAPAGEVARWVVAGLVVVVAVVLAALFKTGRLKIKRTGKQRKPSHDDVASGSGFTGNTPPAASEAPVPHQYPVAYQYPEAVQ
ncbi:unnamed protein product [Ectocarpus sp. 12 AP-2014]